MRKPLSLIPKQKKGQVVSVVAFFVIILSVLILATLLMSFVNTILNPATSSIGNVSSQAGNAMSNINASFNKWWDVAVVLLVFLNIIILMISAYQIDTHPVFLIVYIIAVMLLVIFGGNVVSALSGLWDANGIFGSASPQGVDAISRMPMTAYILNHFTLFIFAIIVLSGIIMYSKFKFSSGGMGA